MPSSELFPLSKFFSLLGVHTALLLFVALYLPSSSFSFTTLPQQASSRDRPQHPFLRPITADPFLTLLWLVGGVAVVQASWATWLRKETEDARVKEHGEDTEEARLKRAAIHDQEKLQIIKEAVMYTLSGSTLFFVVLWLFGAPTVSHLEKTYLLALLLSILNIYPAVYTLRSPSFKSDANSLVHRLLWSRLFIELSPRDSFERMLVYPVVGGLSGAWLGVFPIALDWDRPWQAWPLTPAYGAIAGYIIASWVALIINTTLFLAETDREQTASDDKAQKSSTSGKRGKGKKTKVK